MVGPIFAFPVAALVLAAISGSASQPPPTTPAVKPPVATPAAYAFDANHAPNNATLSAATSLSPRIRFACC